MMRPCHHGQSVLEYLVLLGLVAVVLSYVGVGIKRGVQSLVKVTADQVGNQQNADQDFNDEQTGYMIGSNTVTQETTNKQVTELGYIPLSGQAYYVTNTSFNESAFTMVNSITNGGFAPN